MLTIPNQGIKVNQEGREIRISALKLTVNYQFPNNFSKINQIELDKEFMYVSVTIDEKETYEPIGFIGVDLNSTSHVTVTANNVTGKIEKLGKEAPHIHTKYRNLRKKYQKKGKLKKAKQVKQREQRKVKDIYHKISNKIVKDAVKSQCGIKLEDLTSIRKTAKHRKSQRYSLNSWSFYQLRQMIDYKAKKHGVHVFIIDPAYTSKKCSRCQVIGTRDKKFFKCSCGHVDHADVNAAFNIANISIASINPIEKEINRTGTLTSPKKQCQ
jgi:putative transposase